jgi:hypothetical protein
MSFSLNVAKWSAGATADMAKLNKAIIFSLFSSVIKDTPVDEGRLRGNWIISSKDPANGTVDIEDPQGNKSIANVADFIRGVDGTKDFDVYLTNNLPYAFRIEYDGWSHTKAPAGMVRKNLIRITSNLAART